MTSLPSLSLSLSLSLCISLSLSLSPKVPHAQYRKRFRASYNEWPQYRKRFCASYNICACALLIVSFELFVMAQPALAAFSTESFEICSFHRFPAPPPLPNPRSRHSYEVADEQRGLLSWARTWRQGSENTSARRWTMPRSTPAKKREFPTVKKIKALNSCESSHHQLANQFRFSFGLQKQWKN